MVSTICSIFSILLYIFINSANSAFIVKVNESDLNQFTIPEFVFPTTRDYLDEVAEEWGMSTGAVIAIAIGMLVSMIGGCIGCCFCCGFGCFKGYKMASKKIKNKKAAEHPQIQTQFQPAQNVSIGFDNQANGNQ